MNFIINIFGKYMVIVDLNNRTVISIIEYDYGLVKYLNKILSEYTADNQNRGYIHFDNKNGETYLHRIILEYYSQFNTKLCKLLSNKSYEVNHINKKVWDNRLENLELVTRTGQERHKCGLKYDGEIVMTTEEILNIKNMLLKNKQYQSDKKYLEKVSHAVNQAFKGNIHYIELKIFDNPYVRFNNLKGQLLKSIEKAGGISTYEGVKYINFYIEENTFFEEYKTHVLIVNYNKYRYKKIIIHNLRLIRKYYKQNRYFKMVCNKYNLLNIEEEIEEESEDDSEESLKVHLGDNLKLISRNIIIDLFINIFESMPLKFYKNQLYMMLSIKDVIITKGKYNSMRVLYLLKLLIRKKSKCYRKCSELREETAVSSFFIYKYTDEMFKSHIIPISKKLIKLNLSTITYTIIEKNFSTEIADFVYQSPTRKKISQKSLVTISDIEKIFSSFLLNKIRKYGYITISDIRCELIKINNIRRNNRKDYIKIRDKDNAFISKMIRNITEIKDCMKGLKIDYKMINKKTRAKIEEYQKKNGIKKVTIKKVGYRQRIIILKKLYRGNNNGRKRIL